MTKNEPADETMRDLIDEALDLYGKGEWNKAIRILEKAYEEAVKLARLKEIREIDMHMGWNYWKKQEKETALHYWLNAIDYYSSLRSGSPHSYGSSITQASAHAGLGIYYAEKGDKENALRHAKLAQELLPESATMNQVMNLNACAISIAKIGELGQAEKVLRKVAKTNERLEERPLARPLDPVLSKKAKHQRAKNGYNLASLVYLPQRRYDEAIKELFKEVIPRYIAVEAETDLAAAYHRLSEAHEMSIEGLEHSSCLYAIKWLALKNALDFEKMSLALWEKHPDDPKRAETAKKNIQRIKEKIEKLKQ